MPKLREEFSFFKGNYAILVLSWILMDGWHLHTYACSTGGGGGLTTVNHYLLFENGD